MARKFLISRLALAVAVSGGMAVGLAPAAVAKEEKKDDKKNAGKFSPEFVKAAGPIQTAINDATTKLPQGAGPDQFPAAKASIDAALGGNGKATIEAAKAVATTPDDKLALGQMTRTYGVLSQDLAFKQSGVVMMIDSGKLPPESLGATYFDAGLTAFNLEDYTTAATYVKQAKDAGYQDPQGQMDLILAESYKRGNNPEAALAMAKADIDAAKAKGVAPSEASIRSVLQQTYNAKQVGPSSEYAAMLVQYYPSPASWNTSISIVRQLASLDRGENVDLMRLMFVTGSMKDKRDYLEYLDNVDPRAYPGEGQKVMDQGIAKGLLTSAEVPDRADTARRVPGDKATLPATERDGMKPTATAAQTTGAGDVHLSYGEYAKAEQLYTAALAKPGVDANKANLRLGMAQAMQPGKAAAAQASFAKVTGTRQPVARLWAAYAAGKTS